MRYKLTDKIYLFVYGTLLSNESNYHRLGREAILISQATIRAKMFTLNNCFPYIRFSNSSKDKVYGQLFQIPYHQLINSVDQLEGYKPNHKSCLYFRKKTTVTITSTNTKQQAFVYVAGSFFHNSTKSATITSGNWKQFKLETLTKNTEHWHTNHIDQIRSLLPTEQEVLKLKERVPETVTHLFNLDNGD
jgi:gamma-glutamylcyclotransferase (GGCT)/AIG2-like uncharacterized protein YtfP